jgi:hypothetical protein
MFIQLAWAPHLARPPVNRFCDRNLVSISAPA